MTKSEAGGQGIPAPVRLEDLKAMRTDYQDVAVPQLGDNVVRMWALTGTERAGLIKEITALSALDPEGTDPETVERVLLFQCRVVAASLHLDADEWDGLAVVMGSGTVEDLYDIASVLSKLDAKEKDAAVQSLPPKRSAASGTD